MGYHGDLPAPDAGRYRYQMRSGEDTAHDHAVHAGPVSLTEARVDLVGLLAFNVLSDIAMLVLITLGLGVIYGMMRITDRTRGEFMVLGAHTTVTSMELGMNIWIATLLLPPIVVGLAGLALERVPIRFLYGHAEWYNAEMQSGGRLDSPPHVPGRFEHFTAVTEECKVTCCGNTRGLNEGKTAPYHADTSLCFSNIGSKPARGFLVVLYRWKKAGV